VSHNSRTSGLRINAAHSGEGLVMNIHLGPVGQHAISFHSGGDYSGAVDQSRVAERMAAHRIAKTS
jgi:hypothetical protein